MNKAPPSVEKARKKLIEKSNKKINKEIKRLESKMDDIYQTAVDLNDDWNDGGKPEADKEELDRMAAKIENLRRKLKGGEPKKTKKKKKRVQFSECLNNEDCEKLFPGKGKVCYHQATGWKEDPSLLGTCVDWPAEFKKNDPSVTITSGLWQGKKVTNPYYHKPQIGIPHGSELLGFQGWGGKKIGLWGNRIKKSMKRLKRKRRKTRKRKRKKSRKKRKRRKRRKTRR